MRRTNPPGPATTADSQLAELKKNLRRHFLNHRESLSENVRARLNADILEQIVRVPELAEAGTVHVYYPSLERHEVDTRPLIRSCLEAGQRIVLPVVVEGNKENESPRRIMHRVFDGTSPMLENRWGILEPAEGDAIDPGCIDVAIVPALAVDESGFRLGYGGGFYDRFLGAASLLSICPVFESAFVEALPRASWDVPVDIVVTDARTWHRRKL